MIIGGGGGGEYNSTIHRTVFNLLATFGSSSTPFTLDAVIPSRIHDLGQAN